MPNNVEFLSSALDGRYVVERELGKGGMSTVYLAEDTKHGRKVAIKVLDPEVGAAVGSERFLREIRIVAQLSHPHILPLIDSGDADGRLYFVAPYVAGGSLRDRLEYGAQIPVADVIRIAREVGAGLDYAHRQGFVHRDVKPQNILFADGLAVLADFGIARALGVQGPDSMTAGGMAIGTPEYMSPEQATGDPNVGARSDIYSLACVVYEMLTREPPLRGDNAQATLIKQVTIAPRPVRALRPDTPPSLEGALTRALSKNADDRFASVTEFVEALSAGDTGTDMPIAMVAARVIAVLPFVNNSPDPENEYLSDGITDELIDALAKVDGLRVSSRTSVFALKGKPQDVRAIGALLGASWVLEGTMRRAGERLRVTAQLTSTSDGRLLWSQRFDRTFQDVFDIQEEIARTIVDTLRVTSFADLSAPPPMRSTRNVKAYGLYLRGRFAWNKRTQEGVAEAIRDFTQATVEDPGYALAYTGLADSYALGLDYKSVPVAEGFALAKEYARRALVLDDTLAEGHASLAWSLFIYDWEFDAADREFRRAIELDPRYATAHQWQTFLLVSRGQFAEAIIAAHTALELDPASVSIRRGVGWAYYYARRYEQARYHLSRAIAMNPAAEESYRVMGLALVQHGQHKEGLRVLREAVKLATAGDYDRAVLGYALARAGQRDEAAAELARLEAKAASGYVSPVALATICLGLEDWDRALDWTDRAYVERRGWMVYLNANPIFDPVRASPRFQELVRKMNLAAPG